MSDDLKEMQRLVVQILAQMDQQLATLKVFQAKVEDDSTTDEEGEHMLEQAQAMEVTLKGQALQIHEMHRRLKERGKITPKLEEQHRALVERFGLEG